MMATWLERTRRVPSYVVFGLVLVLVLVVSITVHLSGPKSLKGLWTSCEEWAAPTVSRLDGVARDALPAQEYDLSPNLPCDEEFRFTSVTATVDGWGKRGQCLRHLQSEGWSLVDDASRALDPEGAYVGNCVGSRTSDNQKQVLLTLTEAPNVR